MILGNKGIEEAEWQMRIDIMNKEAKQRNRAQKEQQDGMMQIIGLLGADMPNQGTGPNANRSQSTLGQTLTKDFLGKDKKEITVEAPKVEIRLDP